MLSTQRLLDYVQVNRLAKNSAANDAAVTSTSISVLNITAVTFIVLLGAITNSSTINVTVQGSDTGEDGDMVDTEVTKALTGSEDDKMIIFQVQRFNNFKSLRINISGQDGTHTIDIDSILALTHGHRSDPPTQPTDVIAVTPVSNPEVA